MIKCELCKSWNIRRGDNEDREIFERKLLRRVQGRLFEEVMCKLRPESKS